MVYRRCLELLRNHEDAENAVNSVFERLLKKERAIEFPKNYLRRMATNMSFDELEKRKKEIHILYAKATNISLNRIKEKKERETWNLFRTNQTQISDVKKEFVFDEKFEFFEQIDPKTIIESALNEADEMTRDIFVMRYHDNMTFEQIGKVVGRGKSAVEKRMKKFGGKVKRKFNKDKE